MKTAESGPTTVSRKVSEGAYTTLEELETDVRSICAAQIASLKEPEDEEDSRTTKRLSEDDVAQMQDIMSFQLFAGDVIKREMGLERSAVGQTNGIKTNGVKEEQPSDENILEAGRTVLSLFGNAPNGRQLFSSLQDEAGLDMALQELGLPTMLVATKVLPTPKEMRKSRSTFGEVFAPPATLPALQPPPRQSKLSANRSSSISFTSVEKALTKPNRKGTYTVQPMTSGRWLRYGCLTRRRDELKTKLKDRSLAPADQTKLREELDTAIEEPYEEDLFTAAYSSFAPTRDDSRAVIPSNHRDLIWWQKVGKRRVQDLFALEAAHEDEMEMDERDEDDSRRTEQDHETKMYEELLDTYDESAGKVEEEIPGPADMEDLKLLEEITQLLRVLASHQRIRHSILQASSRNPSSPSPLRNAMVGTPTEPSPDEVSTYRNLRSHLAHLVSRLPPYLVAKLDGVQVEDLAVSKTFLVEGSNMRGVMEEDQVTRAARATAAAAAAASATAANANRQTPASQYSQLNRWPSMGNQRNMTPQQAQNATRTAMGYGRTSLGGNVSTPVQNHRPYAQAPSFTAPVNRTVMQPGATTPQYYQRQTQAITQGSPQPQQRPPQYPNASQQQYAAQMYNHNLNAFGTQKIYSQPPQQQGQRQALPPNTYGMQQQQQQQVPNMNGRSTPVANMAGQGSPVKTNVGIAASPQPQQQQVQQPQTNGTA